MSWRAALGHFLRPAPEGARAELAAEVRAELEHHLACAAREEIEHGVAPAQARAAALARFGDPSEVERACLRIHEGGRIVLHRIHLAVTVALFLGMLALGWNGRRAALAAAEATEVARALAARIEAEAPARARARAEPVEHIVIEVGDVLQLRDEYNEEVNGSEAVAADGKVLLPDAGWVAVAGLTREQAEEALSAALAPYFLQTQVRVKVTKPWQRVEFDSF